MDFNLWIAIGKVKGQPQVTVNGEKKQVSLTLVVNDRSQNANGQWVDRLMDVPVYGFDKKAELIEQYVVPGQELTLQCKYQNWGDGEGNKHHGFIILNVVFGFKPRENAGGGGVAGSPSGPPM